MLLALDNEIARVVEAGEFWPTVRDIIAQRLNQLPDQD
jgi:hypothetical protein